MVRSKLVMLGVVMVMNAVACGSRVDAPEVGQAIEPLACSCTTCGTQATPYTSSSPNSVSSGIMEYVDPRFANAWAVQVEPTGECRMGQYSKAMTVAGLTAYAWVRKTNVECPACVCRMAPGADVVGDAGPPCGSP
jgi:hypothetical protein